MKRSATSCHPMKRRSHTKQSEDSNNERINSTATKGPGRPCKISTQPDNEKNPAGDGATNISPGEKIKREATKLYNEKKYDLASKKYTILIDMCPKEAIYYGNRAACYMMLEDYLKALNDAKEAVRLCPTFIKGHCRVIRCALKLHEFIDMDTSVAKLEEIDPSNEVLQFQAQKKRELIGHLKNECAAVNAKDYEQALEHLEKSLGICPRFLEYKAKKAKYLAKICNFSEAETLANDILTQDSKISDAHYALGRCFYETDLEKSVHHFDEAFRLNPACDNDQEFYQRAKDFLDKKTAANIAYKSQHFSRAYDLYNNMITKGGLNKVMKVTLLFNMAETSYKLGNINRCLSECEKVLNLKPNHLKALMRRAQCYLDQKQYHRAIECLEVALMIESSSEALKMLKKARRLLEAAKDDFHGTLGVAQGASTQEINRAYKELTKVHHPDRHVNASEGEQDFHERKCKEITRAYRLLMEGRQQNGGKSKRSSSNNNSHRPKASKGANDCNGGGSPSNGQQPPSGNPNNSSGPKPSAENSHNCGGQQSSASGTNKNPNKPQTSSKGPNISSNGQQSSTDPNNKSNPQAPSGATNNDRQKSSAGGADKSGSQSSSAGCNNN
ncbi:dnaJ homolog subfamily C member 7 [Diachasma alloeum]|uniref:dnaJ homolog subfamily C member 7 n=1 Tax=Diachasma alloeum TaxID=454923 RepID=UPI0007382684|nr:dnaJ homolog subfamily C member 7 [Diachasma alloeum]XP_015117876.1 dnaJ homolog subfamily C member 7 [Diachasma alloeum]